MKLSSWFLLLTIMSTRCRAIESREFPQAFWIGERVEVVWKNKWYLATIEARNTDGTFQIKWHSNGVIDTMHQAAIRKIREGLQEGNSVIVVEDLTTDGIWIWTDDIWKFQQPGPTIVAGTVGKVNSVDPKRNKVGDAILAFDDQMVEISKHAFHRIELWKIPDLKKNDIVEVLQEFQSNDVGKNIVTLRVGLRGTIYLMQDGDAVVSWNGINQRKWVLQENFQKLRKIQQHHHPLEGTTEPDEGQIVQIWAGFAGKRYPAGTGLFAIFRGICGVLTNNHVLGHRSYQGKIDEAEVVFNYAEDHDHEGKPYEEHSNHNCPQLRSAYLDSKDLYTGFNNDKDSDGMGRAMGRPMRAADEDSDSVSHDGTDEEEASNKCKSFRALLKQFDFDWSFVAIDRTHLPRPEKMSDGDPCRPRTPNGKLIRPYDLTHILRAIQSERHVRIPDNNTAVMYHHANERPRVTSQLRSLPLEVHANNGGFGYLEKIMTSLGVGHGHIVDFLTSTIKKNTVFFTKDTGRSIRRVFTEETADPTLGVGMSGAPIWGKQDDGSKYLAGIINMGEIRHDGGFERFCSGFPIDQVLRSLDFAFEAKSRGYGLGAEVQLKPEALKRKEVKTRMKDLIQVVDDAFDAENRNHLNVKWLVDHTRFEVYGHVHEISIPEVDRSGRPLRVNGSFKTITIERGLFLKVKLTARGVTYFDGRGADWKTILLPIASLEDFQLVESNDAGHDDIIQNVEQSETQHANQPTRTRRRKKIEEAQM